MSDIKNLIERIFENIPDGKINDLEQQSSWSGLGWSKGDTWSDLLQSQRVLIISEAGAGKTHECKAQAERLWDAGEPAFFVELASLACGNLRDLLSSEEEARLDAWLLSQSDTATFFLDSLDELKLSAGSFQQALKRLKKGINNKLRNIKIIITTRPTSYDEQLVRQILPIDESKSTDFNEETFADSVMNGPTVNQKKNTVLDWRSVLLMPLSDKQIVAFAQVQGIEDADNFMLDLRRNNALDFARRPQDLIELCAGWREYKCLRTHHEQVESNIHIKLLPREDRREAAELSVDKAIEGASRLALAMLMMRRWTIRHSTQDIGNVDVAIDPAVILSDWNPIERKALLERPLFGFSSYGRVRFHHRSVAEFLAAKRLAVLRDGGMTFRALKRILCVETKEKTIVLPSKRAIAGWLAQLHSDELFELLRDHEPAVLLNEGDPQQLTLAKRVQVLRAYSDRFSQGGFRGLRMPYIQVHRFASKELAVEIKNIWNNGVESPDVRDLLINIIEAGCISECADVVYNVVMDVDADDIERAMALNTLVVFDDVRLGAITTRIAKCDNLWSKGVLRNAVLTLFPKYMSAEKLCQFFRNFELIEKKESLYVDFSKLIAAAVLDLITLKSLRDELVRLASEGLKWQEKWPHIVNDRPYIEVFLAATCLRGLELDKSDDWFYACVLALGLRYSNHHHEKPVELLRTKLANLAVTDAVRLFWESDKFLCALHTSDSPNKRIFEIAGLVNLNADRDVDWVFSGLRDASLPLAQRETLLEAALYLSSLDDAGLEWIEKLKVQLIGEPDFVETMKGWLKQKRANLEEENYREQELESQRQVIAEQKAKDRDSWIQFWREIATQPERAFSADQSYNTVWDLWKAMPNDDDSSRSSGWNRRFIESHFDTETADRMRRYLMEIWRSDTPTLPSERPEKERNTYLKRWQLGLAAIYAEAEDPKWASKLDEAEAKLALRYVLTELNSFPLWLEALADEHPAAVREILGDELAWELNQIPIANNYSELASFIERGPEKVAKLFLSQLVSWLEQHGDRIDEGCNIDGMANRIRWVTSAIIKNGEALEISALSDSAINRLNGTLPPAINYVWLQVLMRVDPQSGVRFLEELIKRVNPDEQRKEALALLVKLFSWRSGSEVNLKNKRFSPQLLLRLLRFAYRYTRPEDDEKIESSGDMPDEIDDAHSACYVIMTALFEAKGEEGWAAKIEMSADPLCAHIRDRILAVAEENWAQEIDLSVFDNAQAVALDREGRSPILTNEAMFTVLKDRLSFIDDFLLRDASPRALWATISDEKIMRREMARVLRDEANFIYTVDQEAVTADEKETDIRLRSVASAHEAVIELKLGDGRTAKDLLDTIEQQLVKKYMAAENSRSGALLITLNKDRTWEHPDEQPRRMIGVDELFSLLRLEAKRVEEAYLGAVAVTVHFLDLRTRLPTEKDRK